MTTPIMRPPQVVLPPSSMATANMTDFGHNTSWQGGRERCISDLVGTWRNVDMPGECYDVRGLRVIRTDARGTREFTLHWDCRVRRWRWGPHGRLLLVWVADDAIAWVPEQASGAKDSRAWRWERCINIGASASASSSHGHSSYEPWRRSRHNERQRSSTTRRVRRSWSRDRNHRRNHSRERSRRRRHSSRDRRRSGAQSYDRHHHSSRWLAEASAPLPCGLTQREFHDLLFREITPEDYEMLLRLDESVAKPSVAEADAVTASLDKLPLLSEEEIKDSSCTICLNLFEVGDAVPILPCQHHFHRSCLARWLAERPGRPTCPLCCKEVFEA